MKTVTSKDGTKIAFDQIGSGPAVILVDSALADRTICAKLAAVLPNAAHKILKDQHHGSVVMSPNVVASEMMQFFKA